MLSIREGFKKKVIFITSGGRGGQRGSIITFYFFVPNVLKIISRHYSFFKYRGRGPPWSPLWSMANIECVVADIMHGVANILHGEAVILCGMASILRNVPDILHV